MDKRKLNGGHSTKATNPKDKRLASKVERQKVYELLNPYTDLAVKTHVEAIENKERWAVELFYKYQFALPKQEHDVTSGGEVINVISLGNGINPDEVTD